MDRTDRENANHNILGRCGR